MKVIITAGRGIDTILDHDEEGPLIIKATNRCLQIMNTGCCVDIEVIDCTTDAQKARIHDLVIDGMMNQVGRVVRR